MYAISNDPKEVRALFIRAKEALSELFISIDDGREPVLIPRTEAIFSEPERSNKLYLLSEGNIIWSHEDRDIFLLEPGDMFGVAEYFGVEVGRLRTEFAVRAFEYDVEEFLKKVEANKAAASLWRTFLSCHYSAMTWFVILLMQGEKVFSPRVRSFQEGEVIIEQGSTGTDVYTLLEGGAANVAVDGVKVGEIHENELFGVFAALTGGKRTASVTAAITCLAVVVSQEEFLDLIKHMPDLALKAMTDMSRAITDLNAKFVNLAYRNTMTHKFL